jgi:hypothetical protein
MGGAHEAGAPIDERYYGRPGPDDEPGEGSAE